MRQILLAMVHVLFDFLFDRVLRRLLERGFIHNDDLLDSLRDLDGIVILWPYLISHLHVEDLPSLHLLGLHALVSEVASLLQSSETA